MTRTSRVRYSPSSHWKVTVVAKGVLGSRQGRELREAALNSIVRELGVEMAAGRIRVPGQNVVRGKRQQRQS